MASLSLKTSADFPRLVDRYRIPLDDPKGQVHARLVFDGLWRLNLDFHDAAWQHLLGVNKAAGEPYFLAMSGRKTGSAIRIMRIESSGAAPRLRGVGSLQANLLTLNLKSLQAPAFT